MMLDTHVWIWINASPERLSTSIRDALLDSKNNFYLSAISIWELAVLVQRGRLDVGAAPEKLVLKWLKAFPVQVLPLEPEDALASRTLPFEHDDPADRFIAATAHRRSLTLLTDDRNLTSLNWLRTSKAS